MRLLSALSIPALVLTLQFAQAQPSSDEAAIRAVIARETEGWDKFDPKLVASVFTEDAIWQNPFGVRLHGKAQLEKFLTGLMAQPGYRAGKDTSPLPSWTFVSPRPPQPLCGLTNELRA